MSSKKDRLKGAIKNELKGDGIMREFVRNVNEDKKSEPAAKENGVAGNGKSDDQPREIPEKKSRTSAARPSKPGRSLPIPRHNTPREWWISFLAFLFVVFLVFGIYFVSTMESPVNSYVKLSTAPLLQQERFPHGERPNFQIDEPVYISYFSNGPLNSNIVYFKVYIMTNDGAHKILTSSQYTIDPQWNTLETHFQKEFFDYPGIYEIVIENENKVELARQQFEIKR